MDSVMVVVTDFGSVRVRPKTFMAYESMSRKRKKASKASARRAAEKIERLAIQMAEYKWITGSELREI
jgi:hypothetical protein